MLDGYYWAVFDTYAGPNRNCKLFLRYTACLCGPREEEGAGDWKKVQECKTESAARRLTNKLNAEEAEQYRARVRKLEEEGLCTSDAQAVVDAEIQRSTPIQRGE